MKKEKGNRSFTLTFPDIKRFLYFVSTIEALNYIESRIERVLSVLVYHSAAAVLYAILEERGSLGA